MKKPSIVRFAKYVCIKKYYLIPKKLIYYWVIFKNYCAIMIFNDKTTIYMINHMMQYSFLEDGQLILKKENSFFQPKQISSTTFIY